MSEQDIPQLRYIPVRAPAGSYAKATTSALLCRRRRPFPGGSSTGVTNWFPAVYDRTTDPWAQQVQDETQTQNLLLPSAERQQAYSTTVIQTKVPSSEVTDRHTSTRIHHVGMSLTIPQCNCAASSTINSDIFFPVARGWVEIGRTLVFCAFSHVYFLLRPLVLRTAGSPRPTAGRPSAVSSNVSQSN